MKAQQEAQAAQAAAAEQAQAQQASADAAGEKSITQEAAAAIKQQRASDQAFYDNQVKNAETWWGATLAQVGRALNNAGYDIAESAVGVAGLAGKAVDAMDAAVSDPVGTLTAAADATMDAASALGNAVLHPVDTANQLANDVANLATTLKKGATDYLESHTVGEMAEDALRLGATALVEAGVGKVANAATTVAAKSLGLADEAVAVAGAMQKADKAADAVDVGADIGRAENKLMAASRKAESGFVAATRKAADAVDDVAAQSYRELRKDLKGTGIQANHLNQDAAFRDVIPRREGLAVGMRGNAFTEAGSSHYEFHKGLEEFWEPYREGNAMYGMRPTNAQYGSAMEQSLVRSGYSPQQASSLASQAATQRLQYGLRPTDFVPRIPGRLPQAR